MWSVLHRHKRLFWVVTAAVIGAAALAAVFVPVKYESQAVVAIGQVSQLGGLDASVLSPMPLEPTGVFVHRLKHRYDVEGAGDPAGARLVSVVNDLRGEKEVVVLRAYAPTAAEAQSFLKEVISASIVSTHAPVYDAFVAQQNLRIALVTKGLAQLRSEIERLQTGSRRTVGGDTVASASTAVERAKSILEQSELETQKATLELGLRPPYTEPTKILREPTLAKRPSHPRPLLYLGLALGVGPLFGLMSVFIVQTVYSSRHAPVPAGKYD